MAATVQVPPDGWQADTSLPSPKAAPALPPTGQSSGLLTPGPSTGPVLFVPTSPGGAHVAVASPPPQIAADGGEDEFLGRDDWDTLSAFHPASRPNDVETNPFDTPLPPSLLLSTARAAAAVLFTLLWIGALLALTCLALFFAARYAMPPVPEPDRAALRWPASRADLVDIHHTLSHYTALWPFHVLIALVALFCFSQICFFPGMTMLLSIAFGVLWGPVKGTLFCLLATIPSTLLAYELDVLLRASLLGVETVERSIHAGRKELRVPHPLRHIIHLRLSFLPYSWMLTFLCAAAGTSLPKLLLATVIGRAPYASGYALLGASSSAWILGQDHRRLLFGACVSLSIPLLASCWWQSSSSAPPRMEVAPRDYGTLTPAPVPPAQRYSSHSYGSAQNNPPSPTPWLTADTPVPTLTGLMGMFGAGPIVEPPEEDTGDAWGRGPTGTASSRMMRPVRAPSLREPAWDVLPTASLVVPVHGHPPRHNPFTSSDQEELDDRTTPQEELDRHSACDWEAPRQPRGAT